MKSSQAHFPTFNTRCYLGMTACPDVVLESHRRRSDAYFFRNCLPSRNSCTLLQSGVLSYIAFSNGKECELFCRSLNFVAKRSSWNRGWWWLSMRNSEERGTAQSLAPNEEWWCFPKICSCQRHGLQSSPRNWEWWCSPKRDNLRKPFPQ